MPIVPQPWISSYRRVVKLTDQNYIDLPNPTAFAQFLVEKVGGHQGFFPVPTLLPDTQVPVYVGPSQLSLAGYVSYVRTGKNVHAVVCDVANTSHISLIELVDRAALD